MADPKAMYQALATEVYGRGNLDLIDQHCAEDYVDHDPWIGDVDRKTTKERIRQLREAVPDIRLQMLDLIVEGDMVCARFRVTGTHTGAELMGVKPSGKKISYDGLELSRMRDGRFVETWTQVNMLDYLRQIGALQPTAAEPRRARAETPSRPSVS